MVKRCLGIPLRSLLSTNLGREAALKQARGGAPAVAKLLEDGRSLVNVVDMTCALQKELYLRT